MNKEKAGSISAEASEKQKKKGRLDGMLEAMDKRSDPLSTHRVATEYFSAFRSERNIANPKRREWIEPDKDTTTAVYTPVSTAVDNKLDFKTSEFSSLAITHSNSESKVYNAIKEELIRNGLDEIRIGLTKLKELTGLSDKTIRISVKSLEMKKSIIIKETSYGIYGRKFFLPSTTEVIKKRLELKINIDRTSKHIIPR